MKNHKRDQDKLFNLLKKKHERLLYHVIETWALSLL